MNATPKPPSEQYASIDGELLAVAQATISVTDEGLLRGDGVFEVIRVYAGTLDALEEHLARLEGSATNLRLDLDVAAVRSDIQGLLASAPDHDGLIRVVVTRGGRRIVLLEPLIEYPDAVRLGFVTFAPTRVLDGVKSLSYAANMLATRLARERGFDEALLVTPHGRVLEGPTSSFFWAADGELRTPPLEDHILASITRSRVIALTGAREVPCSLDDLASADEAFLASTVREVMPIGAIEGYALAAPGPLTARAADQLQRHITQELSVRGAGLSAAP